jgi:hypothetical protein
VDISPTSSSVTPRVTLRATNTAYTSSFTLRHDASIIAPVGRQCHRAHLSDVMRRVGLRRTELRCRSTRRSRQRWHVHRSSLESAIDSPHFARSYSRSWSFDLRPLRRHVGPLARGVELERHGHGARTLQGIGGRTRCRSVVLDHAHAGRTIPAATSTRGRCRVRTHQQDHSARHERTGCIQSVASPHRNSAHVERAWHVTCFSILMFVLVLLRVLASFAQAFLTSKISTI